MFFRHYLRIKNILVGTLRPNSTLCLCTRSRKYWVCTPKIKTSRLFSRLLTAFLVTLLSIADVYAQQKASTHAPSAASFEALDTRYRELHLRFYREYLKSNNNRSYRKKSLRDLNKHVKAALAKQKFDTAEVLIAANQNLIESNLDVEYIRFLLKTVVEQNAWYSIAGLTDIIENSGDDYLLSNLHYQLAIFHKERGALDKSLSHLSKISSSDALTQSEQDYATIIFAIGLQAQKKHRESIKFYDKISKESGYYTYAQLNKAVAFIKQGWWTDAHLTIEDAISNTPPEHLKSLNNRLLVVLGYSQLQHEFYRNARATFRRISLDSEYVNRALLGIGLCAMHQNDLAGAVNVFTRLKKQTSIELPVAESHLLIPFLYDKMQQKKQASIHYREAVEYFDQQVGSLTRGIESLESTGNLKTSIFNEEARQPDYRQKNIRNLNNMLSLWENSPLSRDIRSLLKQYDSANNAKTLHALNQKSTQLKSYQSQAQFGLAKLYDTDQ